MLKGQIKEKSIPFAYMDYEQVNPANIVNWGDYIDNRGEKKEITDLILTGKHNVLLEGEKELKENILGVSIKVSLFSSRY